MLNDEPASSAQAATASQTGPTHCLYCFSEEHVPLFENIRDRLGYVDGSWSFHRCLKCGSALLWPQPDASRLSSFYPPIYSFTPDLGQASRFRRWWAFLEHRLFFAPQYQAQAKRVLRRSNPSAGTAPRVLDIGCGRGLRLRAFQQLGCAVHGMDFQSQVVRYVTEELRIPAVCTDIDGIASAFEPASFDVVTAFYVMEHVPNVASLLQACHRVLKPGGWLAAAVPLIDGFQGRVFRSRWIHVTEAPRHLSLPSRKGVGIACERMQFDDVSIESDSVLNSAGFVALSLVPRATTTHFYASRCRLASLNRLLGAVVFVLALSICGMGACVPLRPGQAIVFARRPLDGSAKG